jgi:hypothetical protein
MNANQLGKLVKTRREVLSLTQRLVAEKLGVESGYIAFISPITRETLALTADRTLAASRN